MMKKNMSFFGLRDHRRQGSHPGYNAYVEDYQEDPYGEESAPNARVWRAFLDEANTYDAEMVDSWKDTTDVLLVFAGLFSAVVTTFVVQTSLNLQPDYAAQSAVLLMQLVLASQGEAIDLSSISQLTEFSASALDKWVNALWFVSLAFSLTTALIAVLIKQWAQYYTSLVSGTAQEQVRVRQFRYVGLGLWHVPAIVGLLPVFMHFALLLFFAGLVIFLTPLDIAIASVVGIIAVGLYTAYFIANVLPLRFPQCPYRTQISEYLFLLLPRATALHRRLLKVFVELWSTTPSLSLSVTISQLPRSLKEAQMHEVDRHAEELDVMALSWLHSTTSNPAISSVILQAVGGLTLKSPQAQAHLEEAGFGKSLSYAFQTCFVDGVTAMTSMVPGAEATAERLARSMLQLADTLSWSDRQRFDCLISSGRASSRIEVTAVGLCYVCLSETSRRFRFCDDARLLPETLDLLLQSPVRLHSIVWQRLFQTGAKYAANGQHTVDWSFGIKVLNALPRGKDITEKPGPLSTFQDADVEKAFALIDYLHAIFCGRCTPSDSPAPSETASQEEGYTQLRSTVKLLHVLGEMIKHYAQMRAHDSASGLLHVCRYIEGVVYPRSHLNKASSSDSPPQSPSSRRIPESSVQRRLRHLQEAVQDIQNTVHSLIESDSFFHPRITDKNRRTVLILCEKMSTPHLSVSCWWLSAPILVHTPPPHCTIQLMQQMVKIMELEAIDSRLVSDALSMKKTVLRLWEAWLSVPSYSASSGEIHELFMQCDALRCLQPIEAKVESHQPRNTISCRVVSRYIQTILTSPENALSDSTRAHMNYIHEPSRLAKICQHYTLHHDSDGQSCVSMGSSMSKDVEALLSVAIAAKAPVYEGAYDEVWKSTIHNLVAMTQDHIALHYRRRDKYRAQWVWLHGYRDAFDIIEQLKEIWGLGGFGDYSIYEYLRGSDLDATSASERILDMPGIHAPLTIPYQRTHKQNETTPVLAEAHDMADECGPIHDDHPVHKKLPKRFIRLPFHRHKLGQAAIDPEKGSMPGS